MEMLFNAGRDSGTGHVCNHIRVDHHGELGAGRDIRDRERGHVYAHTGRDFLCLCIGKHQIPVFQKEIYVKSEIGKGERGCACTAQRNK